MNRNRRTEPLSLEEAEKRLNIERMKLRHYGAKPNPEGDKAAAEYWAKLFPRPEWLKKNG